MIEDSDLAPDEPLGVEFDEWLEEQHRGFLEQMAYESGDYTPRREGEL